MRRTADVATSEFGRVEGALRAMRGGLAATVGVFTSLIGRITASIAVFGLFVRAGEQLHDVLAGVNRQADEFDAQMLSSAASAAKVASLQQEIAKEAAKLGDGWFWRMWDSNGKDSRAGSTIKARIDDLQQQLSIAARAVSWEKEKAELDAQRKADEAAVRGSRDRAEAYYQEQLDALEKINRQEAVTVEKITEARKAASNALVQAQLDAELQAARQVFEFRRKKLEEEDAAALAEWTKQMQKRAEDYRRAMQGIVSDFERQMDAATARMAGGLGASMDRMVVILEDIYRSMPRGGF